MKAHVFIPLVAAACLSLLGCDRVTTDPQSVYRPSFITHGALDGDNHPAVVLLVMDVDGAPAFRCSATLIAPKVVLTAGHCAGEPGEFSGMRIFTEADVQQGNNNYPFGGGANTIEAKAWYSHPLFTEAQFYLHDVGVVLLSKPFNLATNQYGKLPAVNQLDVLQPSASTVFTAVGYGLQRINPVHVESQRVRMSAEPHLIMINTPAIGDFSLLLSNNASTGGTCFGDSGGPDYLGSSNTIAAVTSFGRNSNCAGTGGVFRLDRKNVLDFVNSFLH